MAADRDWYWFGESPITDLHRVVIPDPVVELDIVTPGDSILWAIDESETVYIADDRTVFDSTEGCSLVGETTLGTARGATVPAALLASASRSLRHAPVFEAGDTAGFVATDTDLTAEVCRIIPNDEMPAEFSDGRAAT